MRTGSSFDDLSYEAFRSRPIHEGQSAGERRLSTEDLRKLVNKSFEEYGKADAASRKRLLECYQILLRNQVGKGMSKWTLVGRFLGLQKIREADELRKDLGGKVKNLQHSLWGKSLSNSRGEHNHDTIHSPEEFVLRYRFTSCSEAASREKWEIIQQVVKKVWDREEVGKLVKAGSTKGRDLNRLIAKIEKKVAQSGVGMFDALESIFNERENALNRLAQLREKIEQADEYTAAQILVRAFEKENLKKEAPIPDVLALCRLAANRGPVVASALCKNFEQFDLKDADLTDRIELCKLVVKYIPASSFEVLFAVLKRFDLENAHSADLVDLYKIIFKRFNFWSREELLTVLEMIDLENMQPTNRIDLCKTIVKFIGSWDSNLIQTTLETFHLEGTQPTDRIELFKQLIDGQTPHQVTELCRDLKKFRFEDAEPADRINLYKLLVEREHPLLVNALCEHSGGLFLGDVRATDRLELCKLIAKQGRLPVEDLFAHLGKFGLEDVETADRSSFWSEVIGQGWISMSNLVRSLSANGFSLEELEGGGQFFFQDFLDKIKKEKNPVHRDNLTSWLVAYIETLEGDKERIKAVKESGVLEGIEKYRYIRIELTKLLAKIDVADIQEVAAAGKKKAWLLPSGILLSVLRRESGLSEGDTAALLQQITGIKGFKDRNTFGAFARFLLGIIGAGPYREEEVQIIQNVIKRNLNKKGKAKTVRGKRSSGGRAEIKKEFQVCTNLLAMFGKEEFLRIFGSKEEVDIEQLFRSKFLEPFAIGEEVDVQELYEQTFAKFRDGTALFTYYGGISRYPEFEGGELQRVLGAYVKSVLQDTFKEERYDPTKSEHLAFLFNQKEGLKESWLKIGGRKKTVDGRYTIFESDDPCDLLLIGTEIKGSCQSVVSSSSTTNKCLLSYLMNGEVLPIVVKEGEKIVARSVLRLMWDSKNQTPVILQEKVYSNIGNPSPAVDAINKWAIEKAMEMNIPLVSKEIGTGTPYQGSVESRKGFAPYVYSDAAGGLQIGTFEVPNCHTIFSP